MGVIVEICGFERAGVECNGVWFSIRSIGGESGDDCSEGIIQGICLNNYFSTWYPMSKNRSMGKFFL